MDIGKVYKNEKGNTVLDMQIPFRTKESFLVVQNKEKKQDKEPDFLLFGLYGKVGAVWNKISEKGTAYKSASIEMAELINSKYEIAKLHISMFTSDKDDVLYKVVFSGSTQQDKGNYNNGDESRTPDSQQQNNNPSTNQIEIDPDDLGDIPF